MKTLIKACLILFALLVLVLWLILREDHGVNVSSVRWLPAEAHNITYLKMPGFGARAEFEIAQEAWEAWCAGVNKPLRKRKVCGPF